MVVLEFRGRNDPMACIEAALRLAGDWDQQAASFDRLRVRVFLSATKAFPHPEPVEGRKSVMQPSWGAPERFRAPYSGANSARARLKGRAWPRAGASSSWA